MNFEQILELVKTVSASEITAFQYEEGNQKITMQAGGTFCGETGMQACMSSDIQGTLSGNETRVSMDGASGSRQGNISNSAPENMSVSNVVVNNMNAVGEIVKSPLVGRFYTAPSEDAEVFVKVGDTVKKGQVLAIVEAMKLMNEIESDYDGVVTEVLAGNGQGVEYGQPLFRIKVA